MGKAPVSRGQQLRSAIAETSGVSIIAEICVLVQVQSLPR